LFLGFDHLERMLERASKTSSDGYPPYSVEETGPLGLRITLAVAGFTTDDMQITLKDNQLVIRGHQTGDRGTARSQFQRAFVLADVITSGASDQSGDQSDHLSETIGFGLTAGAAAGIEALDARADELLAVAQRAAKTTNERGNEIDAMLAKIREIRTESAAA
jgi:hypothetical protein